MPCEGQWLPGMHLYYALQRSLTLQQQPTVCHAEVIDPDIVIPSTITFTYHHPDLT